MNITWRDVDGQLVPFAGDTQLTWCPQPGSQAAFLSCPHFEVLYEGTRGPGKTDALIMDFAQHCGVDKRTDPSKQPKFSGFGNEWRGILFRQTYPQLADVIIKTKKWFPMLFPGIQFNESSKVWRWPTGEELYLRHMMREEDYWNYHGHCVDEGEVLTRRGWVDIRQVVVGDEALSPNPETLELSWQPVDSLTQRPYSGTMIRMNDGPYYMSFTPEHKLLTVEGLLPYNKLRQTKLRWGGWQWGEDIRFPDPPANLAMLARWLVWSPDPTRFPRHKENVIRRVEKLLQRSGIPFTTSPIHGITLGTELFQNYPPLEYRVVPSEILAGNPDTLQEFLEGVVEANGAWTVDGCCVHAPNKLFADGLCELGIKLGYRVWATDTHTVVMTKQLAQKFVPMSGHADFPSVEEIEFDGDVYCIGVRHNHTFFLRQRGYVWASGNSYPWIGWEELTTWPDDRCYTKMMACSRSTASGIPRKYRSTTNPYGPGHGWVKRRWRIGPLPEGSVVHNPITDDGPTRVAIRGSLTENRVLLHTDPDYVNRVLAAARNDAERRAWLEGDWSIVAGGMFDDIFYEHQKTIVVKPFEIPPTWRIDRSFDWGSSAPFSVGWWAESDGSDYLDANGKWHSSIRGDLFRIAEWYGTSGQSNEGLRLLASDIACGILERERDWNLLGRVRSGVADSSIFDEENGNSIANSMSEPIRIDGIVYPTGVRWHRADKRPGSRKQGWAKMRELFAATGSHPREKPGLFIFSKCEHFLDIVPSLPRDQRDLDDLDTSSEDHIADETRYRIWRERRTAKSGKTFGGY